uniref:non-specific serine/threonine protein kinase n=1 Tax=Geotrypetes seraphini TaxID=260995 RepID=A0A6P8R3R8_GEOSA|nr:serine/threonine-protein kinase 17B isoform X1 [Geotrypetes seraphini]XP_033802714.1 serine/threonine-protein kinase 17B isoform X1 [Geotrypetes seraphini]XP_033802715.1 serine/threonine-protein kinase 17B isoform X1 [Geotrypetes seraphini]XP_033802716.1 serine/threonine-protein kinase 17B isoform X1 [Geotrypetes seraphini]XP_033802717.1 serine/threonine-protein kinase 17B isoform X1 [Geotrypetes seraphini]XP_033802720.1 serine/threonine-protein kinase 17B isoform X1 [Geotrypetes seraphini]
MARRKLENKCLPGLLSYIHIALKTDDFHNAYTLDSKELGRGKFAVVRKCVEKSTGHEYAAKFLKKRRRGQDCRAEIIHEIAVLELTKPSSRIAYLHEAYETMNEIILVLEYAAGGEIFNLCVGDQDETIAEKDVIRLIYQILEGVFYLHRNNIVHLDLKPQNILLSSIHPLGDVKIVDFGMSRKMGTSSEVREIMGTPEYVAPEILNYEPITTAADIWSIGVISYMLLTGESPFLGADKQETYLNISQVNVDYSEEIFASISDLAIDFIQTLLVKNPAAGGSGVLIIEFLPFIPELASSIFSQMGDVIHGARNRATAEACLSHSWLQQGEFINLHYLEKTICAPPVEECMLKSSEEKNAKCICNCICSDKEDKENILDDSGTASKRFRFDDSYQYHMCSC